MEQVERIEQKAGQALRSRGLLLAVAESCTGGLVGHLLTNISGSSDYFAGGVVAYSNAVKQALLGVKPETLQALGAVSKETALEMAEGVRLAFQSACPSDKVIGLSTTGIAGPGGAMPGKPVGLVWIGLSAPDGENAWCFTWDGSREDNKARSAEMALTCLLDYLRGGEG